MKRSIGQAFGKKLFYAIILSAWTATGFAAIGRFGMAGGCPFCGGGIRSSDEFDYANPDHSAPTTSTLDSAPVSPPEKVAPPPSTVPPPLFAKALPRPVRFPPPLMNGTPPPGVELPFPEIKQDGDGYFRIGFEHLASFHFATPPLESKPQVGSLKDVPQKVRALDGKRVCVRGYMLPTKLENGLVREFLLIRNSMMCCYGVMPAPNEWVVVKMQGRATTSVMDTPLNLYGTLHVGEFYDQGMFTGLYQFDGEKVLLN